MRSRDGRPPKAKPLMSAAERTRALLNHGPCIHVPTGFPTLDKNTRGGLLSGRLTVIAGPPDAGKTSVMVQIALSNAQAGFAGAIHCADEDHVSIIYRLGQHYGLSLEELEAGNAETITSLAIILDELPHLLVIDQDDDEYSIEDTAEALVHAGMGCKGLVLAVDSLQTVRIRQQEDGLRERINAVTKTLKHIAKTTGALVMVTSELPRHAYSPQARNPIADMAAFKESGAIEYAMTTGVVLRRVAREDDLIDVTIPKNKRGHRTPFRLKRDPAKCSYEEVMPESKNERTDNKESLRKTVLDYIAGENAAGRPVHGKSQVSKVVKGRDADIAHIIDELENDRVIENRGLRQHPLLWTRTAGASEE